MIRRHVLFPCEGAMLTGTLDEAPGKTALLIVSGGNEIRSGAFGGQAQLAARIAAAGHPVLRFDRRGVGDSEGENREFRSSGPDIAAALDVLRREAPQVERIVGFGNCDAASALMLSGGQGFDALVLSNPWTFEDDEQGSSSPDAARAHYRNRLADPAAIRRLLTGKVSLRKLFAGLRSAAAPPAPPSSLAQDMAREIAGFAGEIAFLVASRDRTGQAFRSAWDKADARIVTCQGATHGYVEAQSRDWLFEQVSAMLAGCGG